MTADDDAIAALEALVAEGSETPLRRFYRAMNDAARKTLDTGAPGLSELSRKVIAGIVARKGQALVQPVLERQTRLEARLREFATREAVGEIERGAASLGEAAGWCDLCHRSLDTDRRHGHAADCLLASDEDRHA